MVEYIALVIAGIALAWNIIAWFIGRMRRVRVISAHDAWYAVTCGDRRAIWVHCVVRFANTGSLPASIVSTQLSLSRGSEVFRNFTILEPSGKRIAYENQDDGTVTMGPTYRAQAPCLGRNDETVTVDPAAPQDREIWAKADGEFDHQFEPVELRVDCVDSRGASSSFTITCRHVAV